MSETTLTGAENVRWDLTCFYDGLDDPRLEADAQRYVELAKAFFETYRGKLDTMLGAALRDYQTLVNLENKVDLFLGLLLSLDTGDPAAKAKEAMADRLIKGADGRWLTFFKLEAAKLSEIAVAAQAETDEIVLHHLPWLHKLRLLGPHKLTEEVEGALKEREAFGPAAWSGYFNEVRSELRFPWEGKDLTIVQINRVVLSSQDAETRAAAMAVINRVLGESFAKFSALTLFMVAGAKDVEDRTRGYAHPMAHSNLVSMIPDEVVESLHEAVLDRAAAITKRYYRLKAAHLGMKTLKWSDRNAPMPFKNTAVVTWDKAVDVVGRAYASFSPTLAGLFQEQLRLGRLDASSGDRRRGGAFNSSTILEDGTPASFEFFNFEGTSDDVSTLAHEVGHGFHGFIAGTAQGPLMQHAPIAFKETASVFGESVAFHYLLDEVIETDRRQALAIVMDKMDDVINTVVRQITFSLFERGVHGHDAETMSRLDFQRRSAAELSELWVKVAQQMHGEPGEVLTYENMEHLWASIPHFHRPFYVYSYAFGELLTHSLMAARERLGERFEPLYLDLLRAGGTKGIVELLAPFGLDPCDPEFWNAGIEASLGRLLRLAEELSAEMGVTIA